MVHNQFKIGLQRTIYCCWCLCYKT